MPTTHNFTGQQLDSQTGLLYYNFRYYDPVSGRFTRADTEENNTSGMDPYGYVGGNPETRNDPTGERFISDTGQLVPIGSLVSPPNKWNTPGSLPPPMTNTPPVQHTPSAKQGNGSISRGHSPEVATGIKNLDLYKKGWAEVIVGGDLLIGAIASLTAAFNVPFLNIALGLARNLVRYGLAGVIRTVNSGISDIMASLDHPNLQVMVAADIVKIILDAAGILTNLVLTVTSIQSAVKILGNAGSFARAITDMSQASSLASGGYKDAMGLATANLGNFLFGGFDLWGDWLQFQQDKNAADAKPS